ncbi:hypothetical protein [Runella sp.]|jgi:hypothetical protein|uniref:hypothetical protein n=1 Tax=Runella sp. TaxID=1960881 RepID=UPI0026048948|nr:hypothetical protein [Runella sp.]
MSNKLDSRSLWSAFSNEGHFLLIFTGLILIFSGLFIITQVATGHFLPHDSYYLGLNAQELSRFYKGRITYFMFHDRVAFGGSIISVGILYMWLAEFPLRNKEAWAWWVFLFSGCIGFGSFLTYLGFGYFDTWHGIGTALLIPFYVTGLVKSYQNLRGKSYKDLFVTTNKTALTTRACIGKILLQLVSTGLFLGGIVIMTVGMTTVFVPQDLEFMEIPVCGLLDQISPQLIPLIAHDRACFGGGLATIGLMLFFIIRRSHFTRNLWEVLFLSLFIGFSCAIGIHFIIEYTDLIHLAPAYLGFYCRL